MSTREKTITEFMIEEQRRFPVVNGDFTALLNYVRLACKRISFIIGRGALAGAHASEPIADGRGETPMQLDAMSNDIFLRTSEYGGHLAGMVSEELDEPYQIPPEYPLGKYLLAFDPLDGSSNIDINAPVGSIFSVLKAPRGMQPPTTEDFLQPGARQLCAGYAIYGATTMLVLTVGRGVHGFTLDRGFGEFVLTHPNMTIPDEASEFAINASNERFWEPPVKRYVSECLAGQSRRSRQGLQHALDRIAGRRSSPDTDPRRAVHVPEGQQGSASNPAGLRLLYEANPMAMLVEQAGGAASAGRAPNTGHCARPSSPARAADSRVQGRGGAHRALSFGARPGSGSHLQLAAVQRALAVPAELTTQVPQCRPSIPSSRSPAPPAPAPPPSRAPSIGYFAAKASRRRWSKATPSIATTARR